WPASSVVADKPPTVTRASGTAAPDGSVTVPLTATCASAANDHARRNSADRTRRVVIPRRSTSRVAHLDAVTQWGAGVPAGAHRRGRRCPTEFPAVYFNPIAFLISFVTNVPSWPNPITWPFTMYVGVELMPLSNARET